jgi:hypothetical protein
LLLPSRVEIYLRMFFLSTLSDSDYIASNDWMICEYRIGKNVEWKGRSLIWGTVPEFAWRNWEKSREISVRIDGLQAEIWIQSRTNTHSTAAFGNTENILKLVLILVQYLVIFCTYREPDSSVSIWLDYRLNDRGIGIGFPTRSRVVPSPQHPDWLCSSSCLLSSAYRDLCSRG